MERRGRQLESLQALFKGCPWGLGDWAALTLLGGPRVPTWSPAQPR